MLLCCWVNVDFVYSLYALKGIELLRFCASFFLVRSVTSIFKKSCGGAKSMVGYVTWHHSSQARLNFPEQS